MVGVMARVWRIGIDNVKGLPLNDNAAEIGNDEMFVIVSDCHSNCADPVNSPGDKARTRHTGIANKVCQT